MSQKYYQLNEIELVELNSYYKKKIILLILFRRIIK